MIEITAPITIPPAVVISAPIYIGTRIDAGAAAVQAEYMAEVATAKAEETAADVLLTNADAIATAADRVQTGLDTVATAADVVATAADRIQTGSDLITVAADKALTAGYKNTAVSEAATSTAQAVIALAQAGIATGQAGLATTNGAAQVVLAAAQVDLAINQAILTAADRVQTGADQLTVAADKVLVAADKDTAIAQAGIATDQAVIATAKAVLTAADVTQTALDRIAVAADKVTVAGDKAAAAASAGTATTQAGIATTKAGEAAASADTATAILNSKDASGGMAGLTLFKINFKNALNTFTSFFTNANTAARTYTFQDRDGTIADNTDIANSATAVQIHAATDKATPVDVDELSLTDSAATFGLKKLTWANLKATLKTYFDTLYANDTAWVNATLVNSWVTDVEPVKYKRMANGLVIVNGAIKNGTYAQGTTLFTLPEGYRPGAKIFFVGRGDTTFPDVGFVNITDAGVVAITSLSSAKISFSLTFKAEN